MTARFVAGALLMASSWAWAVPPPAAPPPSPDTARDDDEAAEVVYVERTQPDRIGRILAPVYVNGQGPFKFIVDTGASRSVIAPHVAQALGLAPDASRPVQLRGITGTANVPSILVEKLRAGDLKVERQRMPVIVPGVMADADGILGVDGFKNLCLRASFVNNDITITRKGCPLAARDWPRARATMRFGGLVMVSARIGGQKVKAIIDTGAERSLGNPQLLKTLALENQVDPALVTHVLGATPERIAGSTVQVPTIYLGEFEVTDLYVTFGDLEVFRIWNLQDQPTIVLGMDVLGNADGLVIDYRRGEIRVQPKGTSEKQQVRRKGEFGRL